MTYDLGEWIEELRGQLLDAQEHIAKLEEALYEIYDLFEDEQDADQPQGDATPTPNRAMRICMIIDAVIKGNRK